MEETKKVVLETVQRINHEISIMTSAKNIKDYLKECQAKLETK